MADDITHTESVELRRHLAECSPAGRFGAIRIEDASRYFRTVTIEPEELVERTAGGNPSAGVAGS